MITDPFIPPIKNTSLFFPSVKAVNQKPGNSIEVVTKNDVKEILYLTSKYYLQQNYQFIIDILDHINFDILTDNFH